VSKKPDWKPFLDRGRKRLPRRKTIADSPDRRVGEVEIPRLKPKDLRARRSDYGTDPRVRAVDLQFTRWAGKPAPTTSEGGNCPGISQVVLRKEPEFGALALDDAESLILDSALKASPRWASEFVEMWYKRKLTTEEIAVKLEMKRREYVYDERERVLFYWFGRLTEIGFALTVEPE
jgi:hypothetical protein